MKAEQEAVGKTGSRGLQRGYYVASQQLRITLRNLTRKLSFPSGEGRRN